MDYTQLSEKLYEIVKAKVSWRKNDRDKIAFITKFLQENIERELSKIGLVPSDASTSGLAITEEALDSLPEHTLTVAPENTLDLVEQRTNVTVENKLHDNVAMSKPDLKIFSELPVNETQVAREPHTLLQRIVVEADEIVPPVEKTNEPKVKQAKPAAVDGEVKRYYIEITCSAIITKPKFQIFKAPDIRETDFKTDNVIKQATVFNAVVDVASKSEIQEVVAKHFAGGYLSKMEPQEQEWIPPQYATIWQNRTSLY